MKRLFSILAVTLFASAAIPSVQGAVQLSVDFFHDNLEAHGDWREVGDYGYCWQPRDVDRDWRPYRDGRWLYTDAGWTWDSDEPYSWAVYHYGRWARVDRVGWVWVPGTEWGPAWVSWRRSERHVGWAPLPPEATFSRSIGFNVRVDADYDIGPTNYSFVNVRDFGSRRLSRVIVAPQENFTIINRTTNITNITYVNNTVINNGPQYDVISRESALPIRKLKLDRREDFDGDPRKVKADQLRNIVKGDSVRIAAPSFDTAPAKAPRKVVAKVEKADVNRGWKDAGTTEEVAKLRAKIKDEPARPNPEPSATPKNEKAEPVAKPEPKAPTVANEAPVKDGKVDTDAKMPQAKAPKKVGPKAGPKADVPPESKPAIAKPVSPKDGRPIRPSEEKPKKKRQDILPDSPKKSEVPDAPVRQKSKQRDNVPPGRASAQREAAPKSKLQEPQPPAKKRAPAKPDIKEPVVKKPVRLAPPAVPLSEPAKGKGKKKDKNDEVKPGEAP